LGVHFSETIAQSAMTAIAAAVMPIVFNIAM